MRQRCLTIMASLLMALVMPAVQAAPEGWELAKDRDGIRVYTREVAGSKFRAFRGETVIDAELNQVMALLDDTPGMGAWMYKTEHPVLLQKTSLLDRYQYLVNDFPWPATDRELLIRNQIYQDPATRVTRVSLEGVSVEELPSAARARVPETDGLVRVTDLEGFYELTPVSDSQTAVVFQLHLDPVGALPASVVNAMIVDNPFETLKSMAQVVKQPKYHCFRPF